MPVFIIAEYDLVFPHPSLASEEGILALGGDLSPERILMAYKFGIFPWYNEGDPILWWSPDPRFVLKPGDIKIPKSMKSTFNQNKFKVSFDTHFEEVIELCQNAGGRSESGTWLNDDLKEATIELHRQGHAHSVEVWQNDKLVGGLYGIAFGNCFSGDSMFSLVSNASKFGFIKLAQALHKKGFQYIDCQQETAHLKQFGAQNISRAKYLKYLKTNLFNDSSIGLWTEWIS